MILHKINVRDGADSAHEVRIAEILGSIMKTINCPERIACGAITDRH